MYVYKWQVKIQVSRRFRKDCKMGKFQIFPATKEHVLSRSFQRFDLEKIR